MTTLPILYFLAGFASCFVWLYFYEDKDQSAPKKKKKKWDSITNLNFSWDFDYTFAEERRTKQIVHDIAYLMHNQMDAPNTKEVSKIIVSPGDYSIRIDVNCSFVRRPSENKE